MDCLKPDSWACGQNCGASTSLYFKVPEISIAGAPETPFFISMLARFYVDVEARFCRTEGGIRIRPFEAWPPQWHSRSFRKMCRIARLIYQIWLQTVIKNTPPVSQSNAALP